MDNWGENPETAELLAELLSSNSGTYLPLCSSVYFLASYVRDEDIKQSCIRMANAGSSQTNIFKLKSLRKTVRNYFTYFENINLRQRYPEDLGAEDLTKLQVILLNTQLI